MKAGEGAVRSPQHFGTTLDFAAVVSEHQSRRPIAEAAVDGLLGRLDHFAGQTAQVFSN